MPLIEWAARYSADENRAIAVGETLNGFEIRATCLMSRARLVDHVVILGVREDDNGVEYVVAQVNIGATEWWQGHYTRDVGVAVATYMRLSSLGDLLPDQTVPGL